MRVRIFTVDQTTGEEKPVGIADSLNECIPDDADYCAEIERELAENSVAWVGGGAAQLFKLTTAEG